MADDDDKTEEPTDKKIEDAKNEGNVNKSAEVTGAAILTLGSMYLLFFSSYSMSEIKKMMMFTFNFIGQDMDSSVYYAITYTTVMTFLSALMPLFVLIMVLIFATN